MENFGASTLPRFPICFCFDLTESMMGKGIEDAKKACASFKDAFKGKNCDGVCLETAFVTFSDKPKIASSFSDGFPDFEPRFDLAGGSCDVLEALGMCLDIVEKRKNTYRNAGISYRRPWIVLISDGILNDQQGLTRASKLVAIKKAQQEKKCWVIPVQAGLCDIGSLENLTLSNKSILLDQLDFDRISNVLSVSMSHSAARETPEDDDPVSFLSKLFDNPTSWDNARLTGDR